MLPVLYSFRRCPYAIRARLALVCAGVAVQTHEVSLRDKPPALLALSPKGTVPVLHCPDGRVIDESLDIMRWALHRHDPAGWLPRSDTPAQQALLAANDGAFKHWLDRYKYANRHPERSAADYRDDAAACLLVPLEAQLALSPCLGGATPGLTDAAIFPFVRQFAAVDAAWWSTAPWPHVRAWLDGWLASELFALVMRKERYVIDSA
ncbi:MAG: glutathione S-transferase [Ramlibacter sp.]